MKKSKLLSLAFCLLAAMSLTSCLGDDDENKVTQLTPGEIKMAFNVIKGSYTGYVYFLSVDEKQKQVRDSVKATWEIPTDSTLIIKGFKSSLLAKNITDAKMKTAIEALPDQDIPCRIRIFQKDPIGFYVLPIVSPFKGLTYNAGKHDVQVAFWNNTESFGVYDLAKNITEFRVIEAGVVVDGKASTVYSGYDTFVFSASERI
ncbi:MAG: DUF4840 domain-containing protein [Prevotella sp.]|nr:DUF4840 domain-containing protein [Prevotella sp.]